MSCEISVIYPGLEGGEVVLEIPETRRAFGIVSFGSDPTVCFGSAPGMGGFVLDRWEAEEYGILPRHCALLWAGGKFRLEFDRHAGVYLNGSNACARSFCNPFEDGAEFTMRLGLPDTGQSGTDLGVAPVFKIRRKDKGYKKASFLTYLATRYTWFRKVAMIPFLVRLPALVMGVVALALIMTGWNLAQGKQITEALIRDEVSEKIGAALAPSVASIGVMDGEQFTAYGTAWLYEHVIDGGASSKWLVTNFHVVQQIGIEVCATGQAPKPIVARFPDPAGTADRALQLPLNSCPKKHPLYEAFDAFKPNADGAPGQQAVANVYDLAAFKLSEQDHAALLSSDRTFLKLEGPAPKAASSFGIDVNYTQNLEPGRPVLILSYPTENQPFLADGVSADPFQFRTSLQSKSNAMSRSIPGSSSNRTPALYSFSAKSAGGMSGSPVIALDRNGAPFVSGIVFSASFVRGPANTSDGGPTRLASGDGTYALDATSLTTIQDWPGANEPADFARANDIKLIWGKWASDQAPADEKRQQFKDLNAAAGPHTVCAISESLTLDRRVEAPGAPRGESARALPLQFSDKVQNTLITVESRSRGTDALLQLAVSTERNGRRFTNHLLGLNQATYLKQGRDTSEIEITVAGPLDSKVVVTIYQAFDGVQTCPKRGSSND